MICVPQSQGPALQCACNDAPLSIFCRCPCQIVETVLWLACFQKVEKPTYPVSVVSVAVGFNSGPCWASSSFKSHSSKHVSLLKSTSTAPDFVPVASQGDSASGDQAKVAVRGISLNRTMVVEDRCVGAWALSCRTTKDEVQASNAQ